MIRRLFSSWFSSTLVLFPRFVNPLSTSTSGTTGKPKGAEGTHRNWTQLILVSPFQVARQFVRQGEPLPVPDPNAIQRAILISVPLFQ
jgi:acyl-CoA synthetase (AMP-forming)/AMP-acid ligase II